MTADDPFAGFCARVRPSLVGALDETVSPWPGCSSPARSTRTGSLGGAFHALIYGHCQDGHPSEGAILTVTALDAHGNVIQQKDQRV